MPGLKPRTSEVCLATDSRAARSGDFYPTPAWCVERLLDAGAGPPAGRDVVEPAAGEGAIVSVLAARGFRVHAVELRAVARRELQASNPASVTIGDWLTEVAPLQAAPAPFSVVMNPPFNLCFDFVKSVVTELEVPYAAALLRLGFKASIKRAAWNDANPTTQELVLGKRPSFTEDGRTDSNDYAWFVWERGAELRPTRVLLP